jgi:hypothetical protein
LPLLDTAGCSYVCLRHAQVDKIPHRKGCGINKVMRSYTDPIQHDHPAQPVCYTVRHDPPRGSSHLCNTHHTTWWHAGSPSSFLHTSYKPHTSQTLHPVCYAVRHDTPCGWKLSVPPITQRSGHF